MTNCPCDRDLPPRLVIAAGLNALPRQIRAFPEVRQALLASLPKKSALRTWRARGGQDLGIMLLEMWAYVSDVLAFYDERIANETYLRTAQRRPSLRRLVELLGYFPAPGVAAKVILAAIADGRDAVTLPAGTGFRSDAFGSEPPQVFEIGESIVIHPFKNQWAIGPLPKATIDQPTPSEAQSSGSVPNDRSFLVFNTLCFGLARNRLALVKITESTLKSTGTSVKEIRPFGGKDGKTYAEVEFAQSFTFEDVASVRPDQVRVLVPTVTAVVTKNTPVEVGVDDKGKRKLTPQKPMDTTEGSTTVFLDSIYRQLRLGDDVLIIQPKAGKSIASPIAATVGDVTEGTVQVTGTDVLLPVTKVQLDSASIDTTSIDDEAPARVTFHFSFVSAGTVTTVGETELARTVVASTPLPVTGIVERPPEVEPGGELNPKATPNFLLSDVDNHGAAVQGKMLFDTAGHATFTVTDGKNLPQTTFKTPITVYGNVLVATRGETVFNEVLGSGDPRTPNQKFRLKKKPLTYLPASTSVGRQSTLGISVDQVEWREVTTFFNKGPQDQVFTVRHDDAQETVITFGDGVHGARLPSGVGNVVATYRFGSGAAAPPAGAIQQLARTVLGLRSVRSPVAATPGKDPDSVSTLRTAAPKSVLIFDRAVSPPDFAALAELQAGVVKAQAEFNWDERAQQAGVHVSYIGELPVKDLARAGRARPRPHAARDVGLRLRRAGFLR